MSSTPSIATALAKRFTEMQDRAQRAEHEVSRQREVLSLCPIPVMLLNKDAMCLYANPAWSETLKCDYIDLLGDNWRVFIHPDDRVEVTRLIDTTIRSDMEAYEGEHRLLDRQENILHVRARVSRTQSGDYIAYVVPTKPGCSAICLKKWRA